MTIWLLALLLLTSLALVGYSQGAIRVGFSLIGIFFATLLAVPLGRLIQPVMAIMISHPILLWAVSPFIMFCLVMVAFKVGGLAVHRKLDVHYRYHAGELRLALWERTNRRMGACLGLVNGLAYLVLVSFVIHSFGYWTVQITSGDEESRTVRLFNRVARDLESSGLARAASAVGPLPDTFYDAADLAGLLFHHPLLEARLSRYPGLLSLGERPEFQSLGLDAEFRDLRLKQSSLRELLANQNVSTIAKNYELLRLIWTTTTPDLKDLDGYLRTQKSSKYDSEAILGRWSFDMANSMVAYRREKPNLPAPEIPKIRRWMEERFGNVSVIAAPDKMAVIKNLPVPNAPGAPLASAAPPRNLQGNWKKSTDDYVLTFPGEEPRTVKVSAAKLTFKAEGITLAFRRES